MGRQGWACVIGAGLCSVLPGCIGTFAAAQPVAHVGPPHREEPKQTPAETASPYTLLPPPPPPDAPASPEPPARSAQTDAAALKPPPAPEPEPKVAPAHDPAPKRPAQPVMGPEQETPTEVPAQLPAPTTSAKTSERPLVAALECFLDKRPSEALGWLDGLDRDSQELLLGLFPVVARIGEGDLARGSPQDVGSLLDEIDSLTVSLRAKAELSIDNICFCKRIRGFGVYETYPPDHRYRPGDRVDIYVELRNFSSRRCQGAGGDVTYVTRLASSYEVHDYSGKVVWKDVFQRAQPDDVTRTLRHDYFENYHFVVPDIAPGAYTLWIKVEDQGTPRPRTQRRSLDFRVGSTLAQGP
jgi:hypothetical protein